MSTRLFLATLLLIGCSSSEPAPSPSSVQALGGKSPPAPHPNAQFPYVNMFQPTAGKPGDSIKLLGGGLTGTTQIVFGAAPASTFTVDSDVQLTATVPAGAVSGAITVTTPVGSVQSNLAFAVSSTAAPTITDFNPKTSGGGSGTTVTGTNFAGVTSGTVNGFPALFVSVQSDTQLQLGIPRGAGTGSITVTNNIGTATSSVSFVGLAEPRIVSVTPPAAKAGDLITVSGAHFTGATIVNLGGAAAVYTVVNDSTVTLTVPAAATDGQIRIQTPMGDDSSNLLALLASGLPTVTLVAPSSVNAGDSQITVTGTNFRHVTQVKIGGLLVNHYPGGDSTTMTLSPSQPTTGAISITNNVGTAVSTQTVTVNPQPIITGTQPASGKVGDAITINGTGLTGATLVYFGSGSIAPDTVSDLVVTAKVPAAATPGQIYIALPAATAYSQNPNDPFQLLSSGPPTVASFTPATGQVGTNVMVTGTNLIGTTGYKIGGYGGGYQSVTSDSTVDISAIAGMPAGPITMVTNAGTTTSAGTFTPTPPTIILSYAPKSGKPGDTVTLTGLQFGAATQVLFQPNSSATFALVDDSHLTAVVPAGAIDGSITVVGQNVSNSTVGPFTVTGGAALVAPRIAAFQPGGLGVGSQVQVSGVGFTGATQVTFNGTPTTFDVQSDPSFTTVVPVGASTGVITVTTPRGTASSADPFVVLASPVLTAIAPSTAKIGDLVTLTGANLSAISDINLQNASVGPLTQSDTQLTFVVPPLSKTGPLTLTSPGSTVTTTQTLTVQAATQPVLTGFFPLSGRATAAVTLHGTFDSVDAVKFNGVDAVYFFVATPPTQIYAAAPREATTGAITVINSQGTATSSAPFTVLAAPVISSVTPASGKPGDAIAIVGSGFADGATAEFRGITCATNVQDANNLIALVPPGARTGRLRVATTGGDSIGSTMFTVVAPATPMLTDFNPAAGGIGHYIELVGVGFTGLDEIRFNGTPARILWTTENRTRVTVPPGATSGPITAVNAAGTASSPSPFTVIAEPIPAITSFSPVSGQPGDLITITGTDFDHFFNVAFSGDYVDDFEDAPIVSRTGTTATVKVPRYAQTGPLRVASDLGENVSITPFLVPGAPRIDGFQPASGPIGTSVTLTGVNLTGATAVGFAGTAATFIVGSDSAITTTVPAGAITGPITVTTPLGTGTSAANFVVGGASGDGPGGGGGGCGCDVSSTAPAPIYSLAALLLALAWGRRRRQRSGRTCEGPDAGE